MSHFSQIKTKLKPRPQLLEALVDLGYPVVEQEQVMVVSDAEHAKGHPDVNVNFTCLDGSVGFKWNGDTFEMVTDEQTWDNSISIEFFLKKLTQQYALRTVVDSVKEEGFQIQEQVVNEQGAVEIVVTRWS